MAQFELNRTKDKSKIDAQLIKDGSAYLAVDEQSQSGDLYIDYGEKRYNVSGNIGYKKITTKGFKVVNWNGRHGESGTYTLRLPRKTSNIGDLTDESRKIIEELNKLNDKIQDDNISVYYTIMNDMNGDSFGKIVKINATTYSDIGLIILEVDKLYTNSLSLAYDVSHYIIGQTGLNNYKDTSNGNAMGSVITNYPDLGWMIKARENGSTAYSQQACLFINDYPELGTFDWFQDSYALEKDNLAQGKVSFAQGQGNKAYGKYSTVFGNNNKAGYADAVFGRSNDASGAQVSFVAGQENVISDLGFYHTVFGEGNKITGGSHKLVAGKFNKEKNINILELGYGSGNLSRKNIFEVDKDGKIYSNEMENMIDQKVEGIIFDIPTTVEKIGPIADVDNMKGQTEKIDPSITYGCYLNCINADQLKTSTTYIIHVKIAITWNPSDENQKLELRGYYTDDDNYSISTPMIQEIKKGQEPSYYLLSYIFTTGNKSVREYGFYVDNNKQNEAEKTTATITYYDYVVYQLLHIENIDKYNINIFDNLDKFNKLGSNLLYSLNVQSLLNETNDENKKSNQESQYNLFNSEIIRENDNIYLIPKKDFISTNDGYEYQFLKPQFIPSEFTQYNSQKWKSALKLNETNNNITISCPGLSGEQDVMISFNPEEGIHLDDYKKQKEVYESIISNSYAKTIDGAVEIHILDSKIIDTSNTTECPILIKVV